MSSNVDVLLDENGKGQPITKDTIGNFAVTTDIAHYMAHAGVRYKTCYFSKDVDSGNALSLAIAVGAKAPHMTIDIDAVGEIEVVLRRTVTQTISVNNALDIINKNHNSLNASTLAINHTPTMTNSGDVIMNQNFGDGKKSGAALSIRDEDIYKLDTDYNLTLISGAANNKINVCLDWYEI